MTPTYLETKIRGTSVQRG